MKKEDGFIAKAEDLLHKAGDVMAETGDAMREALDRALARLSEGVARLRKLKIDPPEVGDHKAAIAYLVRGRKHYNKKRYGRAGTYFRHAVRADESYALAHYFLGLALYQQDDPRAARAAWARSTEVDPKSESAAKARRKIEYVDADGVRIIDELEDQLRGL